MRRFVASALAAAAIGLIGIAPAWPQRLPVPVPIPTPIPTPTPTPPPTPTPTPTDSAPSTATRLMTPLAFYVAGGIVCSAVSPIIGTIILGREMTGAEVGRSTLNCFLGPVGWVIGPMLFPDIPVAGNTPPPRRPPARTAQTPRGGRGITIPPPGETRFVPDEV